MMADLRVPHSGLDLQNGELLDLIVSPLTEAVNIYDGPSEFTRTMAPLTLGQRAIFALTWCTVEVSNGGLFQLFQNSTGILAEDARAGARRIGAVGTVAILDDAFGLFPGAAPAKAKDVRADIVERFSANERTRLAELSERLEDLFESEVWPSAATYVRSHPAEFVRDR